MFPLDGGDVVDIRQVQQLGGLVETLFGEGGAAVLFVDRIIARGIFFAGFLAFDLFPPHELGNDAVDLEILVGGFPAGTGNDERGAGFVDQDGVHFVDDGVVVAALHAVFDAKLHVVPQIIEAELVVGAVGDVGVVVVLPYLVVLEVVYDDADGAVDLAHPIRVAVGQIVVDGDDVNALAFERVQVSGQGGHQRLAFTGSHFSDLAAVQDDAADQLHVEVAHVEEAAASLADYGESLDEQVVERRSLGQLFLEFDGFGGQIDIGKLLDLRLEVVDGGDDGLNGLDFAFVLGAKNLGQNGVAHREVSLQEIRCYYSSAGGETGAPISGTQRRWPGGHEPRRPAHQRAPGPYFATLGRVSTM